MKEKILLYTLIGLISVSLIMMGVKEQRRQVEVTHILTAPEVSKASYTVPSPNSFPPDFHPVYNFSIIPGGAKTLSEFCESSKTDPALAGFDCSKAREFSLPEDARYFMTFRKNGVVSWTKKPVLVRAGERLYTDGSRSFLARCGNQVRFTPQEPSMDIETSQLDRPSNPVPVAPPLISYAPPERVSSAGSISTASAPPPSSSKGWIGGFVAVVPIIVSHHDSYTTTTTSKCDPIEVSCH